MPSPELLTRLAAFNGEDWLQHAALLGQLSDELQAEGLPHDAQKARWEASVCRLVSRLPDRRCKAARFVDPAVDPNHAPILPDPLTDRCAVLHLQAQALGETNAFLRARYADAIFVAGVRRYGVPAARAYIELEAQMARHNWPVRYDALARAVQISLSVNSLPTAGVAAERLLTMAGEARDGDAHVWTIEACGALLLDRTNRLRDELRHQARDTLIALRDNAAADWIKYDAINHALIDLHRSLGEHQEATRARRAGADNLVAHGRRFTAVSHLKAADFYRRARQTVAEIGGDRAELERLTRLVETETQSALQSGELKGITTRIQLPVEQVRALLAPSAESERLANIGALEVFARDLAALVTEAEQLQRAAPFALGLPRLLIRQGRPAYQSHAEELAAVVLRVLRLQATIYGATICQVLLEACELGAVSPVGMLHFILGGVLVPTRKEPFLRQGIAAFCARDFVTTIHVLVPHIEDMFRYTYGLLGHPTSSMREGVLDAIPLPTVLRHPDIDALFGAGVVAGFKAVLIERGGLNLRHDVAHGLLGFEQADPASAGILVWMLLRLSLYRGGR